ncbi:MAG TPA: Uma2 family endonuclease [Chryseosolibacter sp.]
MTAILLDDSTGRKMSDAEFERFCRENPDLRIERNSNLEVSIMSPNTPLTGMHGAEIIMQLKNWNLQSKTGVVFDASAGFTLPDQSILAPDASWMSNEKWRGMDQSEKESFSHVCPEFVIELRSKSDSIKDLHLKMETWVRNGAELGWLIDPKRKTCWIYKAHYPVKQLEPGTTIIKGEGRLEGFNLDLSVIFD